MHRTTRSPGRLLDALHQSEHVLVKASDGAIYCVTHRKDAEECAPKRQDQLVLQDSLDAGTYVLTVIRLKPYYGRLTLTRGDRIVLERDVSIAYDAPFGPDAEDVDDWHKIAIDAADADYCSRREKPPNG